MTRDIVERLCACHGIISSDPECCCEEAAAEIERLRDYSAGLEDVLRRSGGNEIERLRAALQACVLGSKDWMEKAKAALEPKS